MRAPVDPELLRQAWGNLATHRLRSLLSVLGIVFGVAAVISMLAIGAGARREALALLTRLGLENVYLVSRALGQDQVRAVRARTAGLTAREAEAAARILPGCRGSFAFSSVTPEVLSSARRVSPGTAVGADRGFLDALKLRAAAGRLYDQRDSRFNVCVLGSGLAARLFPAEQAVGRDVRVNDRVFRVVGVLEETQPLTLTSALRLQPGETVFIPGQPFRGLRRHWALPEVDGAVLVFDDPERTRGVADPLSRMMKRFHAGVDDVQVIVPEALLRERQRTRRVFTLVMTAIAAISLLVGGIGITNVMLTSVLERTREIGILRAVGATRRDVHRLFLTEALILCGVGGVLGVLAGQSLAFAIEKLAGWPASSSPAAVLLSLLLSFVVGVLAGVWPAHRAAALDPIEALRFE